jgi:hypothetical protein
VAQSLDRRRGQYKWIGVDSCGEGANRLPRLPLVASMPMCVTEHRVGFDHLTRLMNCHSLQLALAAETALRRAHTMSYLRCPRAWVFKWRARRHWTSLIADAICVMTSLA